MNDEWIFIYVTTPDEIAAKNIARGLIEKKFATCVNIMSNLHLQLKPHKR